MRQIAVKSVEILRAFIKIGVIGFGGGSALIPVIERELVHKRKAMCEDEYIKHTVVSNITPGALPVKLGATCGQQLGGAAGSILGAYAVAAPGVLLTITVMALFTVLGAQIVEYFNYASVGITVFIIYLLLSYIRKTVAGRHFVQSIALCLIAFILTGGKEIREVLGVLSGAQFEGVPVFDISTIDLMIIAFFMILLQTLTSSAPILAAAGALCAAYAFSAGKFSQARGLDSFGKWLIPAMLAMLVILYIRSKRHGPGRKQMPIAFTVYAIAGLFMLLPIILTAASVLLTGVPDIIGFVAKICVSTITSFGGGEAYVSVADGIFVQGGYITPELFYARLVPVANALPGPILVKVAAGIGYVYGAESGLTYPGLLALTAASAAIGACSAVAVVALSVYDSIRDSRLFVELKQYILPVICGMLLSTACAMLFESAKIMLSKGFGGGAALAVIAAAIISLFLITKKRHVSDILLLVSLSAVSILCLAWL